MRKSHYIPVTADVPGINDGLRALIRKCVRTALAAEGVDVPCEINVLITNDAGIRAVNQEMRNVDAATDVLSFPMFDFSPGDKPPGRRRPRHRVGAPGGYADLLAPRHRPGQGIRPLQPPGAGLSHRTFRFASAGLRPPGRRADEGPNAWAGRGHYGAFGAAQKEVREMSETVNKRSFGLDLVRAAAGVLVLSVHFFLNNGFYQTPAAGGTMLLACMARMLCMTCVPLFLVLTGYTCIHREWSKAYYRKLLPVLLTYLGASGICLVFRVAVLKEAISPSAWCGGCLTSPPRLTHGTSRCTSACFCSVPS